MSDELREALRTIKKVADLEQGAVYLHDPDTGEPFGVLIDCEYRISGLSYHHTHLEGDEDED